MLIWQRSARLVVLAVALAVSAAVFVTSRRREAPPAPTQVPRVDPAAVVESSGAFVREVKGEKEKFRVEAERQLSYSNGTVKLMGVKVTVERNGKTFVVDGDEAQVGEDQSSVELTGRVHLAGSDGLSLNAASASYTEVNGIIHAPGAVTFSRGRMSGKGVDFTYDVNRDTIALSDQTVVTFAPDAAGGDAADIQAGSSLLDRKGTLMTFERAVHIVRGGQVIDADRAVATLTEDEQYISGLDLAGSARITKPETTPGGLTSMAAGNITLTYTPNSELLEGALLVGGSSVKIAGEKGSPEKTLAAESLQVALAPDGTTITSLIGRDRVVLDLPAPRGQTGKNVRSTTFTARGDASRGLTSAVFGEGVEYRESGGTPPVQRLVRSRTLDAALGNGLGEIRDARFIGNAQFNDGGTQATAADIRYQTSSGQVELTGNVGNAVPHVTTDQIVVDAVRIEMTLEGPKMKASQNVRAVMQPAKPGAKDARKLPGLMQQDRPANGSSDELIYDGSNGAKAEFNGKAQLWQGETSVKGDAIVVEGRTGNLAARGAVRSVFLTDETDVVTKAKTSTVVTATAEEMIYEEAARRANYKTKAHLTSPDGDITANAIAVYLAKTSNEVERLEAADAVTLRETERVTTGDNLLYEAKGDAYTMSGKLVTMVEKGCRTSTGTKLQFSKATDTLRIDGNEDTRTQTKNRTDCQPPRSN